MATKYLVTSSLLITVECRVIIEPVLKANLRFKAHPTFSVIEDFPLWNSSALIYCNNEPAVVNSIKEPRQVFDARLKIDRLWRSIKHCAYWRTNCKESPRFWSDKTRYTRNGKKDANRFYKIWYKFGKIRTVPCW